MNRTFKALLTAVGIFVGLEIIIFIVGVIVLGAGQTFDANGIPNPGSRNAGATVALTNYGTIVAVILATIGAIVYGVQPRK